jgi:hypothetical protein
MVLKLFYFDWTVVLQCPLTRCGFAKFRKRMERSEDFFRNFVKPQLYEVRLEGELCATVVQRAAALRYVGI